jgi:hypothetical protein
VKPSCSVPAGLGRPICFRPDKDGAFRFAIVQDAGVCMTATLDAASATTLAATITAALNPGQCALDLLLD